METKGASSPILVYGLLAREETEKKLRGCNRLSNHPCPQFLRFWLGTKWRIDSKLELVRPSDREWKPWSGVQGKCLCLSVLPKIYIQANVLQDPSIQLCPQI